MVNEMHRQDWIDTDVTGILPLCLVASTGVGITFVSLLPLGPQTPPFQHEVLYITGKLALSFFVLVIIVQLFRYITSKKKYHLNQTVFWPLRCPHCALILGLTEDTISPARDQGSDDQTDNLVYRNPVFQHPRRRNDLQERVSVRESFPSQSPSFSDDSLSPPGSCDANSDDSCSDTIHQSGNPTGAALHDLGKHVVRKGPSFCKRNKSFLTIYGVLLIFALITIPLTLIQGLLCAFLGGNSKISMISSIIQSTVLLTLIPVSMQFAVNYYDAVFATTKENIFTLVLFISGAVWISIFKIATPVSELLESPYSKPGGPCELNGTMAMLQQRVVAMLTPFNAECAIVALCILWHMWASFVNRDAIRLPSVHIIRGDIFKRDGYIVHVKAFFERCKGRLIRNHVHQNTIMHPSLEHLQKCLRKAWTISILFCVAYSILTLYIEIFDPFTSSTNYKVEVMWSMDIIFILPFFILYMHQAYVSRHSQETFSPSSRRKVEAHDVLLLLCSCGIFCQCIMRLAAGCGILIDDSSELHNGSYKALGVYAVIYSFAIILMIWRMTTFMLQVQGLRMTNLSEIKWVLVCLIYIAVANGSRWLVESIIVNRWRVQCAYYGKAAGNVVGTLLDPFATLYGLHAAVVAYEAYKDILKMSHDQYTSVEQMDLIGN